MAPASCSFGLAEVTWYLAQLRQCLGKVSAQCTEQSRRVCPGLPTDSLPSQLTQAGPQGAPVCFVSVSSPCYDPLSLRLPHSPLGTSSPLIPCPGLFQNLSAYNTRLFKEVDQDGKPRYEVRLASVLGTGELLSIYVGMVNLLLSVFQSTSRSSPNPSLRAPLFITLWLQVKESILHLPKPKGDFTALCK